MPKSKRHNIFKTNYTNIGDNQNIKALITTLWNKHTGWTTEHSEFPTDWTTEEKISSIKSTLSKNIFSASILIDTPVTHGEGTHTACLPVMKKNKSNMLTLLDSNIARLMDIGDMWYMCPKYMNEALKYNMLPESSKTHAHPVFTDEQALIAH